MPKCADLWSIWCAPHTPFGYRDLISDKSIRKEFFHNNGRMVSIGPSQPM